MVRKIDEEWKKYKWSDTRYKTQICEYRVRTQVFLGPRLALLTAKMSFQV